MNSSAGHKAAASVTPATSCLSNWHQQSNPGLCRWCKQASCTAAHDKQLHTTKSCTTPAAPKDVAIIVCSASCGVSQGLHPTHALLSWAVAVQVNPEKRLGCGPGGIQEIKNHFWFSRINWEALAFKQLPAPIMPRLSSLLDTSNFDSFDDADFSGHTGAAAAAASAAAADGKRPVQWDTWQWVSGPPPSHPHPQGAAAATAAADRTH